MICYRKKKKIDLICFLVGKCNFGALLHRGINVYFSVEFTVRVEIILEKLVLREFWICKPVFMRV